MNSPEQINLRKVSISRIKQEMKDVSYLSDDLVITALDARTNATAEYPASIDGFSAVVMMSGNAVVSIDMNEYEVRPNMLVFFNPDSIIRTVKCSPDAAAYFLAFSKSFVNEIQIDLSTSLPVYMRFGKNPCLQVTQQDVDEIRQLFQLIKTMLRSDKERYRHEIIRTIFTAVFYIITELNQRDQPEPRRQGRCEVIFEEFMELLQQYNKMERNVGFYARKLRITPQVPLLGGQGGERQDRRAVDRRVGDSGGQDAAQVFGPEHPGDRLPPEFLDPVVFRQVLQAAYRHQPLALQAQRVSGVRFGCRAAGRNAACALRHAMPPSASGVGAYVRFFSSPRSWGAPARGRRAARWPRRGGGAPPPM